MKKQFYGTTHYNKSQREQLGFGEAGYIMICKGDTYAYKDWLKEQGACYRKWWGWAFASSIPLPELPNGITAVRLDWDKVGDPDGMNLFPEEKIKLVVDSLIYEPSPSAFIGNIGDRLELTLTVQRVIDLDGYYGPSHMHVMADEDGNVFVWTTASKKWETGNTYHIRGTVKEHRVFRNVHQTCLTRCTEIKQK